MSQDPGAPVAALTALGFTEMEAAVYAYLLGSPPVTAYAIAKAIGKPVANTYKTVASLQDRGAVIVDETANRLCSAVPAEELLRGLEDAFERRRKAAAEALARVRVSGTSDGIYSLTTADQVHERAIRMIGDAVDVVLIDAFPIVLNRLTPALQQAAARGVTVVVQSYERVRVAGAEVLIPLLHERVRARWPGQWLSLVADGAEYLSGYLDADGEAVHRALWTANAFIAWPQHSYLVQALRVTLLENLLEEGGSVEALKEAVTRSDAWVSRTARGYVELLEKVGSGGT